MEEFDHNVDSYGGIDTFYVHLLPKCYMCLLGSELCGGELWTHEFYGGFDHQTW